MRQWLRRLGYILRQRQHAAALDEELRLHREMKQQELEEAGLEPNEAVVQARRALGNVPLAQNRVRDVWIWPWLQDLGQDVRFAGRLLDRDRWFTAAAVCTVALGIGATTTVFAILDAMNIRGLPVDQPQQIMFVGTRDQRSRPAGVSYLDYQDWRAAARSFTDLAAFTSTAMTLRDEQAPPDRVLGTFLSPQAFQVLGESPVLGRDFTREDGRPGAAPVVILGDRLWRIRYDSDPGIVGRPVTIDGTPSIVVGVMPEGFGFPVSSEMWRPLPLLPGLLGQPRDVRRLSVLGRLADGVRRRDAANELQTIADGLALSYPATNSDVRPTVTKFVERFNGTLSDPIPLTLIGVVTLVLLIACANVANLLLARSRRRMRELSIRAAVGASRWRVVRQLMVESLLVALCAALLGLVAATLGVHAIDRALVDAKAYWMEFTMDHRVLFFVTVMGAGSSLLFGVVPAFLAANGDILVGLKDGAPLSMCGQSSSRWSRGLVAIEVALTVVVLASATLMGRSFVALYRADLVVDPAGLLTLRVALPDEAYGSARERLAFYDQLDARLAADPAIASATVASTLPFLPGRRGAFRLDRDVDPRETLPDAVVVSIDPRYFETLRLPLVRGRSFSYLDGTRGHESTIVNQRLATMLFPGDNPIGHRIQFVSNEASDQVAPWMRIVGVAPTVRQAIANDAGPVIYLPRRADPVAIGHVIARGNSDLQALASRVRMTVQDLDPSLPVFSVLPLTRIMELSRLQHGAFAGVLAVVVGIGVLLSIVGLYGITAYGVAQRRQEVGIRCALGAHALDVVWLFVRQLVPSLSVGLIAGLGGAVGAGAVLRSLLIRTPAVDVATLALLAVGLSVVVLSACVWPATQALRISPVRVLRED